MIYRLVRPFLFSMVDGADRDRLGWIMSIGYALLAVGFAAAAVRRVGHGQETAPDAPTPPRVPSEGPDPSR